MFTRAVVLTSPAGTQVRGMATLREISNRLRAVKNIQKITKSMKIVSAAKYSRAAKELKTARPYGIGSQAFYEKAEISQDEKKPVHLVIAMSSDRGLCGGIHSNVMKAIRSLIPLKAPNTEVKIIAVGDKQRGLLQRLHGDKIQMHFLDIGKKPPVYRDAAQVALAILEQEYDHGELFYNKFKTVVSYNTTSLPVFNKESLSSSENITKYDSIDDDVLQSYNEFALANLVFFALREGSCSELSARMTAMEAASKNAGEMMDKLAMLYNRKRQSVITSELIEIISGAAALK